jgi:hypothetical protein
MKNKLSVTNLSAATLIACALSATSAHANMSGFGTIPGNPSGAFGGTGIPTMPSAYTQGAIGTADTLTLALSTTAYGPSNPAPTTTTPYVFNVGTGTVGGRSLWDYDFYLNSANGTLSAYTITLTVLNVGNGLSVSYNPLLILDNSPLLNPGTAGNSESLDFTSLTGAINYNANLNDTYDVSLTATDGTTTLSTSEEIIAGTGAAPVPEPTTFVAGGLMLLPFGIGALRKFRKSSASVA